MTLLIGRHFQPVHSTIPAIMRQAGKFLLSAPPVDVGELQSKDIKGIDQLVTRELLNVSFSSPLPDGQDDLAILTNCNHEWAEAHFQERVGGVPLNPGEEYKNWPWYKGNVEQHQALPRGKFSHSYMERYWPRYAGDLSGRIMGIDKQHWGIRYRYGDLNDVVNLLARSPHTRQAYLPVWFPEDTGAVHGERVPCSLGYHFILRDGQLHVVYYIRSCDFVRHFPDDIYLTGRLAQWVLSALTDEPHSVWDKAKIGTLTMHITSLHCFAGDLPMMEKRYG